METIETTMISHYAGHDVKVNWATMSTTTATIDGLLSGNVAFASSGITGLLTRRGQRRRPARSLKRA